ncbi:hypothetical protein ACI2KR_08510 [Pseudomonas luteola]
MTSLIEPSYMYGPVAAHEMKEIMLSISKQDRAAFNAHYADDSRVSGSDAYGFYLNLLLEHGLFEARSEGGMSLTDLGISLATAQFRKPVRREKATAEIELLKKRAQWLLDDPDTMLYIRGLFIFGSYVDTQKDELGDLDVGVVIGTKPEYKRLTEDQKNSRIRATYVRAVPQESRVDDINLIDWDRDNMLSYLNGGESFISFHLSDELPTLRIEKVLWIYDSVKPLASHALLNKSQLKMVNSYLKKTS